MRRSTPLPERALHRRLPRADGARDGAGPRDGHPARRRRRSPAQLYVFQQMFHGSTAPGFLFASGFVAGLPRAPLSLRASLRRARRLLFVLGVGYFLHLPYLSLWKTLAAATPAERAALFACDALQVIAVDAALRARCSSGSPGALDARGAGALALAIDRRDAPRLVLRRLQRALPEAIAPLPRRPHGLALPRVPVLGLRARGHARRGGARPGRARACATARALAWGVGLLGARRARSRWLLAGRVDFWGASPAYAVRAPGRPAAAPARSSRRRRARAAARRARARRSSATRRCSSTCCTSTCSSAASSASRRSRRSHGRLGFAAALGVARRRWCPCSWPPPGLWRAAKHRAPHEAQLALVFLTIAVPLRVR